MKNKIGWLVNDCLTCIPNTKTLWHDLLENIEGLVDKTNNHTSFDVLAEKIESELKLGNIPDYIIRNATYFRKLNAPVKTISLVQDVSYDTIQQEVINASDIAIFNSPYTFSHYKDRIQTKYEMVPLGIDFDFYKPDKDYSSELGILPNSIVFVGAGNINPKGIDLVAKIFKNTKYNFCFVMKDDFYIENKRAVIFNRVSSDIIKKIYNSCKMLICTSKVETQHLAGLEAGACNLPIVATKVGCYYDLSDGDWGHVANEDNFIEKINQVMNNLEKYKPRKFLFENGFDKISCMNKWKQIVKNI